MSKNSYRDVSLLHCIGKECELLFELEDALLDRLSSLQTHGRRHKSINLDIFKYSR